MRTKDVEVQLANHLSAYEIASRVLDNPAASRQQKDRASAILQRAEAGVVRISQEVISESASRSSIGAKRHGEEMNPRGTDTPRHLV